MPVDGALRARVLATGLFDSESYRKTYGPAVDAGGDALGHFLAIGLERGYLPSAGFDPVLYRALVPACGEANPLLHAGDPAAFRPAPMAELFPEAASRASIGNAAGSFQLQRNRAYAADSANERRIAFAVDGRAYELTVPAPDALFRRLREDRPFSMVRLPEGFWEGLWMLETAEAALSGDSRVAG